MSKANYSLVVATDIGQARKTNQDSILVKHCLVKSSEILMAIICDGMGGLTNGELASAEVIRTFGRWFDSLISTKFDAINIKQIAKEWVALLKLLNNRIEEFGLQNSQRLGTTFSGLFIINTEFLIVHIGDSRIYRIDENILQLTEDQTVTAKEVRDGTLSPEKAVTDKRKHVLLQCVGASKDILPQVRFGTADVDYFVLCSDGLYHFLNAKEIIESLKAENSSDNVMLQNICLRWITMCMQRGEKDNISVILIKRGTSQC